VTVTDLLQLLQELDLPESELDELTTALTSDGLTEPVRRRVLALLMRQASADFGQLTAYERAIDLIKDRDTQLTSLKRSAEQTMSRATLEANAKLDRIERVIGEDAQAAKGGATLLLHTDDVRPPERVSASAELSPKQAAALMVPQRSRPVAPPQPMPGISPLSPSSPSLPHLSPFQPLPATVAPLPPTPIAPPAVTEPA
jgi:hypothetical protein